MEQIKTWLKANRKNVVLAAFAVIVVIAVVDGILG